MAYYRPYTETSHESGSPDSDSDSESQSSSGSSEDSIARGLDDPRYAIIRAAGPSLSDANAQLYYQKSGDNNYYDWEPPTTSSNTSLSVLGPAAPKTAGTQSSLFSFRSENRDTNVYPQSTYFSLMTPRTYRNVTQVQIVNINFPYFLNTIPDASQLYVQVAKYVASNNNFTYASCYSCIGNFGIKGVTSAINGGSFTEVGRINPVTKSMPLVHTFSLSAGNYSGASLAGEMEKQMNLTPPFRIISYATHRQIFKATKTADHLFTNGGQWYNSITTKSYVRNPTRDLILKDFLPTVVLENPAQPSEREIFVAYFYPVLKQALSSQFDSKFLDFGTYDPGSVEQRVLQTYEGLSSSLYYDLTYANRDLLKNIRRIHTFEYYPINTYRWSHDPLTQKMNVIHTDIHPALQKDIHETLTDSRLQEMGSRGYTFGTYRQAQSRSSHISCVVGSLADSLNKSLKELGVVPLSADALANPDTVIRTSPKSVLAEKEEDLFALTENTVVHTLANPNTARSFPASFGTIPLKHLLQDISTDAHGIGFTQPYAQSLRNLNAKCTVTRAGGYITSTYTGVDVSCTDFTSLYSTFLNYYSTNTGLSADIQTIEQKALQNTSNYVHTHYEKVLPPALLANNAYLNNAGTGGVQFNVSKTVHYASTPADVEGRDLRAADASACCAILNATLSSFYGCLPANYLINTAFYKLGFGIKDIFQFYSTNSLNISPSTHNLFLQLNLEIPLNNMDIAGKEDYAISNETNSEYKLMLGKLLTKGSSPGAITQTIVQVPAKFSPSPLASLDHFTFKFFLDDMVPLNVLYPFQVTGTDWDAVIQIDEQVAILPPLSA